MIFHIAEKSVWKACEPMNSYVPSEYLDEGFIHCSTLLQVEKTANNYYKGRDDLVLLAIDPEKLKSALRYENLNGGEEEFPHVYGELHKSAITQIVDLGWSKENELLGLAEFS